MSADTFYCTGCGQVVTRTADDGCPNCPGPLGFGTHRRSTTDEQLKEILSNSLRVAGAKAQKILGIPLRVDPSIPPDEVHFYQGRERVGTITNLAADSRRLPDG